MGEPRHIQEQAVGKADLAHMKKSDEDRQAEVAERATEQFGDVPTSPDPYPDVAGDSRLEPRDADDYTSPSGANARASATTADDHQSSDSSSKGAAKKTASSSS